MPINNGHGKQTSSYVNKPSVLSEDYILCNMCSRKYNEQAYSKHIPTCERRTKEPSIKSKMKSIDTIGQNVNSGGSNFKPNLNVKFNRK